MARKRPPKHNPTTSETRKPVHTQRGHTMKPCPTCGETEIHDDEPFCTACALGSGAPNGGSL